MMQRRPNEATMYVYIYYEQTFIFVSTGEVPLGWVLGFS